MCFQLIKMRRIDLNTPSYFFSSLCALFFFQLLMLVFVSFWNCASRFRRWLWLWCRMGFWRSVSIVVFKLLNCIIFCFVKSAEIAADIGKP